MENNKTLKHFVLVHGICLGAWCWYKLLTLLKQAGHRATAIDLGASGVNPKRIEEVGSVSDYLQPLMEFMVSLPDDENVILVGHSYGGLSIALVMENFPQKILLGVFVTSYMPNFSDPPALQMQEYFKRISVESLMDCQFKFDKGAENPPTSVIFGPDYVAAHVFQYCQPQDVELAKTLVRPHGLYFEDMAKESLLTEKKYGSVIRVYVMCEEDEVMEEKFQRFVIENSPPKEVISIARAGHMVMLSQPTKLSSCLQDIAHKYS
ncbi:hypothetical protein LguiA_017477 [Lonicera macranthoides]